jgi:hypothetical protein
MSEPGVFFFINNGSGDSTPHEAGSGANDDWIAVTTGSAGDTLVFTGDAVNQGDSTGERDTVIIPAAGRYVFCIYFDGATASAPYLEMWDDSDHDSIANQSLGAGTPADSMVKGIVTTSGAPGSANWVGHPDQVNMAGSGSANRLDLNAAAAIGSAGGNCYWNMAILIPSTANPLSDTPVTSLRFTYV